MDITEELFKAQDFKYGDFQSKLMPGINRETIIGVRVPILRKSAKELCKTADFAYFLKKLPHKYYDENMLHGLIISEINDYDACIGYIDDFLPYVDNWAVCDIMSPKIFKQHKNKLLKKIVEWTNSDKTYTVRFGIKTLMLYLSNEDFKPEYLKIPAGIKSEEYYIKMMQAWFFATALAMQWENTICYLENNRLDTWTHNKTIQKGCESFRITKKQKDYLKLLKKKEPT